MDDCAPEREAHALQSWYSRLPLIHQAALQAHRPASETVPEIRVEQLRFVVHQGRRNRRMLVPECFHQPQALSQQALSEALSLRRVQPRGRRADRHAEPLGEARR